MAHQTLRSTVVRLSPLSCYEDRDPLPFFVPFCVGRLLTGTVILRKFSRHTPPPRLQTGRCAFSVVPGVLRTRGGRIRSGGGRTGGRVGGKAEPGAVRPARYHLRLITYTAVPTAAASTALPPDRLTT